MNLRLAFLTLLVLAGLMRAGLALRHPLWADEVFSLAMATGHSLEHPAAAAQPERGDFVEPATPVDGAELRKYTQFNGPSSGSRAVIRAVFLSDSSPPLYYLLLYGWCRLWGVGDLALRSLSIVAALGCLPLLYVVGRRVGGTRAGWAAALLFAFAPLSVYYSAEGRMYAWLWLFALLLAWATVRIHDGRAGPAAQAGWMLAAAGGLLTHYYFLFPWAAAVAFLLLRPGGTRRWATLLRAAGVVLLILPWYRHLPESLAQWRVTQDWVNWRPDGYSRLRVIRDVLVQSFSGDGHYLWRGPRSAQLVAVLLFTAAFAVAVWRQGRAAWSADRVLIWLWFGAACAGPVIVDIARGSYIAEYPRYTITALPAACLLGAWAFVECGRRPALIGLALVGVCWLPSVAGMFRNRSRCDQPYHDVARHVAAYGSADDLIVVHSIPSGAIALARYSLTTRGRFLPWVEQLGGRRLPDSLEAVLPGVKRVLLVKVHTVGAPAPEEKWLRKYARLAHEQRIGDARIAEFRPITGVAF